MEGRCSPPPPPPGQPPPPPPPPPGQPTPQFHLFPSTSPPGAFIHNPNDPFHLQNPNFFFPNTFPFHPPIPQLQIDGQVFNIPAQQNPIFYPPQNPSFHGETSGFHTQEHASNQNLEVPQSRKDSNVTLERISEEAVKVRRQYIALGNHVSAWKVSQVLLLALRSESWESLGFQMQEIPALHSLIVTERKINAFIQCFIGVRSITTLYELELAVCENEGVDHFEELELGPFLQHPLVIHYFPLCSTKEVLKITSEDILSIIRKFLNKHKYYEAKIDEQLGSTVENSLTRTQKLNVRIQSFGKHITCIRKALEAENVTLKKYVAGLKQKYGLNLKKRPLLFSQSQKRELDDRFKDLSERVESFASANKQFCGEHKRFSYSSDDDSTDYKDKPAYKAKSNSKKSPSAKLLDIVSNGTYPSALEEKTRLTLNPGSCSSDSSTEDDSNDEADFEGIKTGNNSRSNSKSHQNLKLPVRVADSEDIKTGNNSQSNSKSHQNLKLPVRVGNCPFPSASEEMARLGVKPEKNPDDDGDSTDYEDIKPGNNAQSRSRIHQNAKIMDQVSNSPNRSASKEMKQLGLKPRKRDSHASTGANRQDKMKSDLQDNKRKIDKKIGSTPLPQKIPRRHHGEENACTAEKFKEPFNQDTTDPALVSESTRMFLATWKETCCNNGVKEVVEKMLQSVSLKKKEKKKFKAFLLSHPFAGLLDLAMKSIQSGFWDSMYDAFQKLNCQGTVNNVPGTQTRCTVIEISSDEDDERIFVKKSSVNESGVSIDDIMKKISSYFTMEDDNLGCAESNIENRSFLRKVCSCESWINAEFSVKEFQCFGYGDFVTFLEKYFHLQPDVLQKSLVGENLEKFHFEACMLPLQLEVLLSHASTTVWQNSKVNKRMILKLLGRQFPSFCFKPVENNSLVNFNGTFGGNEENVSPKSVLFSATLLKDSGIEDFGAASNKNLLDSADFEVSVGDNARNIGSVTSKDAIELLSNAPMLMDLEAYSHWDLLYAPSLGPLVGWLLNEVNTKKFLCLVCKGGIVIRLDPSATIDSFLEVMMEGSAFQTSVKLLSLLALYGGELNAPLSLLKSHSKKGFHGLIHNSDKTELDDLLGERSTSNKRFCVASKFILDCLGFLPAEFCSFAGRILLAGFQSFIKDAPSVILSECKRVEQRVTLHDVGFSLGIAEWINDYHACVSSGWANLFPSSECSFSKAGISIMKNRVEVLQDAGRDFPPSKFCESVHTTEGQISKCEDARDMDRINQVPVNTSDCSSEASSNPTSIIESIRRDEFGLDSGVLVTESKMLQKQHARLGRALQCLSHELYSQDSHFLLELVQNADDNTYPQDVEPTLVFILQDKGVVILNNEIGFSAENIKSICDIGNSTKKGSNAGYIGKKGIGFKSVFRVTDAPEIHSNGFHMKFDTTVGEIGFVMPTAVPPCDIEMYTRLAASEFDQLNYDSWRTCIVLPFKGNVSSMFSLSDIMSMFSDLHPSLLLFLHRLKCIKFRNMFSDSLIVMKKEVVTDGIIKTSNGKDHMFWLMVSQKLQAKSIRADVQSTEVSVAFALEETSDGGYIPHLSQQPVFAFLPLRTYGLKFIVQGDFVLPSSREEVDGDSSWNQWLLSEFPGLFVSAEKSFCELPCFSNSPGRAVTAFMSFVPLIGEVHGFFSCLPRMIISRLRMSDCLLLEGDHVEWVSPCKVLRNWSVEARTLLSDKLLQGHLGLGFLNKDIVLPDSLSRALGIEEYGPKTLVNILLSLSRSKSGLENMGLQWLSSFINSVYLMSLNSGCEAELISNLKKIPFIPLSDGKYGSVEEGTIWLHSVSGVEECTLKVFSKLSAKLRTVTSELFPTAAVAAVGQSCIDTSIGENVARMLLKLGVQRLSGHEIVKVHILPTVCEGISTSGNDDIIAEYLAFIMIHLESGCHNCHKEGEWIMEQIRGKASILTNFGYKRFDEVPIHFSKAFGNPIDVKKLIDGTDLEWYEIDNIYLRHSATKSMRDSVMKWRKFFKVLGVTDFVQVVNSEKRVGDVCNDVLKEFLMSGNMISLDETVNDWESPELVNLLSALSSKGDHEKCKFMLEILDSTWDDCFSGKTNGYFKVTSSSERKPFKSSLVSSLQNVRWMVSTDDCNFYFSKDLFHDCEAVKSILGATAPYAAHKVVSQKLLESLGLKSQVTLDDIFDVLRIWRKMENSFKASIPQMTRLYTIIWTEMASSKQKIVEELSSGPFIFVPCNSAFSAGDVVTGSLLSPREVYWHDITGSIDQIKKCSPKNVSVKNHPSVGRMLQNLYPALHNFFVNECGVDECPPLRDYLHILLHLSNVAYPSQAAKTVFNVLSKWADGLQCGSLRDDGVDYLRESLLKKERAVLPTVLGKWVSLHPSFGLVCWSDDDSLKMQFKDAEGIDFLNFGDLTVVEKELLQNKIASLLRRLNIPALSAIVYRKAIHYGPSDSNLKTSLINWALPYAQRYMYYFHSDKYDQLRSAGFEDLTQLQIVVVNGLFYKSVIKGCEVASKKQLMCNCLLEGNTLYITQEADSHSVYMELSRLLFGGAQELHLANFLHMITTMLEAGSTKEQIEFFIVNSQKLLKLPDEESIWSLSQPITLPETNTSQANDICVKLNEESSMSIAEREPRTASDVVIKLNEESNVSTAKRKPRMATVICVNSNEESDMSTAKKKPRINANRPPVDWKLDAEANTSHQMKNAVETDAKEEDHVAEIEMVSSWNYEKGQEHSSRVLYSSRDVEISDLHQPDDNAGNMVVIPNTNPVSDSSGVLGAAPSIPSADVMVDSVNLVTANDGRGNMKQRNPITQQSVLTGRLGELVAYRYFVERVGEANVNWVNENNETGLPYDLVIGSEEEGTCEYIEVKATKSSSKNWFDLSSREWQFASQKGESFSVAHVVLLGNNTAKVTIFKNLVKLSQLHKVRLAVLMFNPHTVSY